VLAIYLVLFAKHFDVGGALLEEAGVTALDEDANLLGDIGIGVMLPRGRARHSARACARNCGKYLH
jgi:hypothetical protein